jgi:hypothetical protein
MNLPAASTFNYDRDTLEAGVHRDNAHWQVRLFNQIARKMNPMCACYLDRRSAEVLNEKTPKLA